MKTHTHIRLLSLIMIVLCIGCQPDNQCRKENIAEAAVAFKDKDLKNISLDSVSIQGVGQDSILYNNKKSVREVSLPLHKTQNQTQFIFSSGSLIDTLTIEHINTENFISLECGCFIYHTIENAYSSGTWIDSVAIINKEITTANAKEHLQLFFD